ncbi:hypothetical protein GM3708_1123 [Geminocystis sp. NIES-3708]|uniref:hypothetical protein n=1 Tax=Geminocystis sp. NIES-3708 TaxID=1615909 RepID=UPI0005FCC4C8|nr:hypothetical protein [Geminocystis sp. NIES-3708]BAQ60717.1 hypothetical protein GM3708_1123 [Geminocystis sp. NIES-3708]
MPITDQFQLLNTLKQSLKKYKELGETDDIISELEIAESQEAWQNYLTGKDKGISSSELKRKLLLNQDTDDI